MEDLGITCPTCATLLKKLNNAREWNKFYHQKLQNKEKFLHIAVDYEREKQRNVELQLAYDQRTRDSAYVREQMTSLLLEFEPLKERLRNAELEAKDHNERREQVEDKLTGLQFSYEQLQHQLQDLKVKADFRLVETLERKLQTSRTEIRRLKLTIENKSCEIFELRKYQADRRLHFERINKRSFWALKLAKTLAGLLSEEDLLETGLMDDMKRLNILLNVVDNICRSQYFEFCKGEEKKMKRENHHLTAMILSMDEWLDDFDKGKENDEPFSDLEPIKREINRYRSREGKKLEEMLLQGSDENVIQIKEEKSSCASVPPYSSEEEADQQEGVHSIKKEQVGPEGLYSPGLSSLLQKDSSVFSHEAANGNKVTSSKLFDSDGEDPVPSVPKERSANSKNVHVVAPSKKFDEKKHLESSAKSSQEKDLSREIKEFKKFNEKKHPESSAESSQQKDLSREIKEFKKFNEKKHLESSAKSSHLKDLSQEMKESKKLNDKKHFKSSAKRSQQKDLSQEMKEFVLRKSLSGCTPVKKGKRTKRTPCKNKPISFTEKTEDDDIISAILKDMRPQDKLECLDNSFNLAEPETCKLGIEEEVSQSVFVDLNNAEPLVENKLSHTRVPSAKRGRESMWERPRILLSQSSEGFPVNVENETSCPASETGDLPQESHSPGMENGGDSVDHLKERDNKRKLIDVQENSIDCLNSNNIALSGNSPAASPFEKKKKTPKLGSLKERGLVYTETYDTDGICKVDRTNSSCIKDDLGSNYKESIDKHKNIKCNNDKEIFFKANMELNSYEQEKMEDIFGIISDSDDDREQEENLETNSKKALVGGKESTDEMNIKSEEKESNVVDNLVTSGMESGGKHFDSFAEKRLSETVCRDSIYIDGDPLNNKSLPKGFMTSNPTVCMKVCKEALRGMAKPDSNRNTEGSKENESKVLCQHSHKENCSTQVPSNSYCLQKEEISVDSSQQFLNKDKGAGSKNIESRSYKQRRKSSQGSRILNGNSNEDKESVSLKIEELKRQYKKVQQSNRKSMLEGTVMGNVGDGKSKTNVKVPPKDLTQDCEKPAVEENSIPISNQSSKQGNVPNSNVVKEISVKEVDEIFGYISDSDEEMTPQIQSKMGSDNEELRPDAKMNNHPVVKGNSTVESDENMKTLTLQITKRPLVGNGEENKSTISPKDSQILNKPETLIKHFEKQSDIFSSKRQCNSSISEDDDKSTQSEMDTHSRTRSHSTNWENKPNTEVEPHSNNKVLNTGPASGINLKPRIRTRSSSRIASRLGIKDCIEGKDEDDLIANSNINSSVRIGKDKITAKAENDKVQPTGSSANSTANSDGSYRLRSRSGRILALEQKKKAFQSEMEERFSRSKENAKLGEMAMTLPHSEGEKIEEQIPQGKKVTGEETVIPFIESNSVADCNSKENEHYDDQTISELSSEQPVKRKKSEKSEKGGNSQVAKEPENSVFKMSPLIPELECQKARHNLADSGEKLPTHSLMLRRGALVNKGEKADCQKCHSEISFVSCDVHQNSGLSSQEPESGLNNCNHELENNEKQVLEDNHRGGFKSSSGKIDNKSDVESNSVNDDSLDSVGIRKANNNQKNQNSVKDGSVRSNINSTLFGTESSGLDEETSENERHNSNGYKKRKIKQRKPRCTKQLRGRLVECSIERDSSGEDVKHGRISDSNSKKSNSENYESSTEFSSSEEESKVLHESSRMVLTSESDNESETGCKRHCNCKAVKRRRRIIGSSDSDDEKEKELLNSSMDSDDEKEKELLNSSITRKEQQLNDSEHEFLSPDAAHDNCDNRAKSGYKPTKKERRKTSARKKFKSQFALRAARMHKKSYYPKPCQPLYQHIRNEDKTASENNLTSISPNMEDRSSQEPLKRHCEKNLDSSTSSSKSSNVKEISQDVCTVKDASEIARRLSMNMKSQNKDKRTVILLDKAPRLSLRNKRTVSSKQDLDMKSYGLPENMSKKDLESPIYCDLHNSGTIESKEISENCDSGIKKSLISENLESSSDEEGTMEICEEAKTEVCEVREKQKVSSLGANVSNARGQMAHPGLVSSLAQLGSLSQPKAAPKPPKIINRNVPASSDFVNKLFSKSDKKLGSEIKESERPSGFSTNSFTNASISNSSKVTESDNRLRANTLKSVLAEPEIKTERSLHTIHFQERPNIDVCAGNSMSFKSDSSKSDDILLNFYGSKHCKTEHSMTEFRSEDSLPAANFSSGNAKPEECGIVSMKDEERETKTSQQCLNTRLLELPGDLFTKEKFMNRSNIRKGEEREDIDSRISDILDLLIHNRLSSQLWQQGINELCIPKAFENDLNAVTRVFIKKILQSDPFEKRDLSGGLPISMFKLFQAMSILERRLNIPVCIVRKKIMGSIHKLITTKSGLRPGSLACLAGWFAASSMLPDEKGAFNFEWLRSFLLDVLYHHQGVAHHAILATVLTSKRVMIKYFKDRRTTCLEKVIQWIVFHGRWEGIKSVRTSLMNWFLQHNNQSIPNKDPVIFIRELMIKLSECTDQNYYHNIITAVVVFSRWQRRQWVENELLPIVRSVAEKDSESPQCKYQLLIDYLMIELKEPPVPYSDGSSDDKCRQTDNE